MRRAEHGWMLTVHNTPLSQPPAAAAAGVSNWCGSDNSADDVFTIRRATRNRLTFITSSQFNVLAVLALPSITPPPIQLRLKTCLFHKPSQCMFTSHPDCLHRLSPGPFILSYAAFVFSFFLIFFFFWRPRLSWPCTFWARVNIYHIVSYRIDVHATVDYAL